MMTLPADPEERGALAAEYVLGTLDSRTARAVEDEMTGDVFLRDSVMAWEATLAPLTALALPEAPPPELWTRIERALAQAVGIAAAGIATPVMDQVFKPIRSRFERLWQAWAVGATVVAAALAAVTLLPTPEAPRMMTVLVSDPSQIAWTAEVDRQGGLRLAALPGPLGRPNDTAPADGRVLQMWALPPGATAPTSLGLVPRGSGQVSIATPAVRPVTGMLIEISLEPPGGAPGALPTGPVLFIGRLSEAGPKT